jgi:HD-GYP domain-containing protein (c-di-GMP phosphodiesterase class II)
MVVGTRMNELIERTHFETVKALSEALDAKDKYTAGHSYRVMEYSVCIAQNMKLAEEDIQRLKKSALLHDLGKIGIPDVILHKKSMLSDEELAVIRVHSEIGANILKSVGSFKDLVPSVFHHHERFDGKGYPHGIQGEDIPLNARIIAIADSFDAVTSDRPYRKAFPRETVLAELEQNKGVQFDPHITNIFIEILKDFSHYFNRKLEPEYYL